MGRHEIELGVDWGTWKCAIAYALTEDGVRKGAISPVTMPGSVREVPMMATWIGDRLVHGPELLAKANKDPKLADRIIYLFKLPLYRSSETSGIAANVERILSELPGKKTLDMLIAEHLKAVVDDAKEAILNEEEQRRFSKQELTKMLQRAKVRITVPEMWSPEARVRMQAAAKNAGLDMVTLASEPICAMAYLLDRVAQNAVLLENEIRAGDRSVVADLGCGTGDFVKIEAEDDFGVQGRVKTVGHASGDLCGSSQVDRLLLKTLLDRQGRGWHMEAVRDLGVTERDFERRTLLAIEECKNEFTGKDDWSVGTVRGLGRRRITFDLSKEEIEAALNTVISRITNVLDRLCFNENDEVDVKIIEVTGGFAKSCYLMDTLKARYMKAYGITVVRPNATDTALCMPVAFGALLRYDRITPQPLPQRYGYAMLQRQPFQQEVHTDAYYIDAITGELEYREWVQNSPYDPDEDVVDDRLITIVPMATVLAHGEEKRKELELEYHVPVANPRLTDEFVYLTKDFKDDTFAKTYNRLRDTYSFKKDVQFWRAVDIPLEKSKLKAAGCKVVTSEDGEKFWKVYAKVVVRARGEDMQIGYQIFKSKDKKACWNGDVAFQVRDTIWEAAHSEFVE